MTISAAVLDFYDDSSHELMSKVAMPTSVGNAHVTVLTPEQIEQMPDTDFGLVILTKRASVLRKFPVSDPGNSWLSAQYFAQTHEKLAFPARFIAAKFIKSACSAYEVLASPIVDAYAARADDDISHNTFVEGSEQKWMLQKLAQRELMTKQADAAEIDALTEMPNEHFALVVRQGDGTVIRKYAMPDAHHVNLAASYFDKYAMDLSPSHRHRFATSVKNRAADLGVELDDSLMLQKWASSEWNQHVVAHIEQRKSLLPRNPEACEVLDKLAAAIGETDPQDMASALETLDRAAGLTKYYDRGLTDPFASAMDKTASGWSADVDGQTVTEADLRKLAGSKKLAGYLGESFARQFSNHPTEVFESLPAPEKVLIKQIISGEA